MCRAFGHDALLHGVGEWVGVVVVVVVAALLVVAGKALGGQLLEVMVTPSFLATSKRRTATVHIYALQPPWPHDSLVPVKRVLVRM